MPFPKSPPTRSTPLALVAALVALCSASTAAAQDDTFNLGGGTFNVDVVEIVRDLQPGEAPTNNDVDVFSQQEAAEFFGIATCACDRQFAVRAQITGANAGQIDNINTTIEAGQGCDAEDANQRKCEQIAAVSDLSSFTAITITPLDMVQLLGGDDSCVASDEKEQFVFYLVNPDGDNLPTRVTEPVGIRTDLTPPPKVTNLQVRPGEAALELSWEVPASNVDDVDGYQVLCRRANGMPSAEDGFPRAAAEFESVATLIARNQCPNGGSRGDPTIPTESPTTQVDAGPSGPDASPTDAGAGTPDAAPSTTDAAPPTAGANPLDGYQVCSGRIGPASKGARIEGLADGVLYEVVVLSLDRANNRSAQFAGSPVAPRPVIDFWETYKGNGGGADGEYCFVATASFGNYSHPFVRILRDFRDDTLATFALGRAFIRWYYANSPPLARLIARHWSLRLVGGVLLAPLVAVAAVWEYTGGLGKLGLLIALLLLRHLRRRRRARIEAPTDTREPIARRQRKIRALATAAGIAVAFAWVQSAEAQPYWDEPGGPGELQSRMPGQPTVSHWNFELKFGPWVPNIDSEFNGNLVVDAVDESGPLTFDGPYDLLFGGAGLLTQIQFDRYLWSTRWGDLGAGVMIGFFRTSANALEIDEIAAAPDENDADMIPEPFVRDGKVQRSAGDSVSFNLMPFAATAVYRFTYLDTGFGVPLVPYGRAGLSYGLWWTTNPDGDTAKARDQGSGESVDGSGGSFGWQATVGLALRLERIDVRAGQSLREDMGIEHASFFFEGTYAQLDGFGSDSKLSVGDLNWAAGLSLEF